MTIKDTLKKFAEQVVVATVLACCSFFNYCVIQIVDPYFLPITIIPVFLSVLLDYKISILTLIAIGILDDIFYNGYIGIFPILYLFIAYLMLTNKIFFYNKKISFVVFLMFFILVNIITHN